MLPSQRVELTTARGFSVLEGLQAPIERVQDRLSSLASSLVAAQPHRGVGPQRGDQRDQLVGRKLLVVVRRLRRALLVPKRDYGRTAPQELLDLALVSVGVA